MSQTDPNSASDANRSVARGSLRWPMIVIGLLAAHVLLMLTAAAIATRDRSFVVLPNYYQNAMHWDQTKAAQHASDRLGWTLAINPSGQVSLLGQRAVTFNLTDAVGKPVEDASLGVSFYHLAHAADEKTVKLTSVAGAPGTFSTTLPMRYAGFYQFDVTADAQDSHFMTSVSQYINTERAK